MIFVFTVLKYADYAALTIFINFEKVNISQSRLVFVKSNAERVLKYGVT